MPLQGAAEPPADSWDVQSDNFWDVQSDKVLLLGSLGTGTGLRVSAKAVVVLPECLWCMGK